MTTPSFLSRIPRSVAAGGAAVALVGAGLLAPQAASASYYPSWTPPYTTCVDAALTTLVAGGQAVTKSGPQGPGYYAAGSGDFLGSNPNAGAAVGQVSPGVWKKVPICR